MKKKYIILGIETSCDEIGISIFDNKIGFVSEYTYNQITHEKHGGTIPELSSRENVKNLINIILFTIKKSKKNIKELTIIAYTKGPGLKGPLIMGNSISKSLSNFLKIPCIGINHLEAHIIISLLFNKNIKFPCLAILTSGAHTMFLNLKTHNNISVLEESIDDGIGEVFDKIARKINIKPYNGKSIENNIKKNITNKITKTLIKKKKNYKLSFSGIKTNAINLIKKQKNNKNELCYKFQNELIKIIINKSKNLIKKHNIKNIIMAGGVASNKELRLNLKELTVSLFCDLYYLPKKYCTDNGSMIAFLGYIKIIEGNKEKNLKINVYPDLKIN